MRGVLLAATVVALALPLLAGCLGGPSSDGGRQGAPVPPPPLVVDYVGTCDTALLFQFIPYGDTDEFLPPGFHPRDPQDFLTFLPVATGQAGVILLVLECTDAAGTPSGFASVGIFVEPPSVADIQPGLFDFYEIDRYGEDDPFRAALRPARWPEHDATITVALEVDAGAAELVPQEPTTVTASVADADGVVASFNGPARTPVDVGTGIVRFWHDGPRGLAVLEVDVRLDSRVGFGACEVRMGTPLAGFVGGTQCLPPAEPVLATFPGLAVDATARFLPGVHAA